MLTKFSLTTNHSVTKRIFSFLFTTTHHLIGEEIPHHRAAMLLISITTQCLLISCEKDKQKDIYPVIVLQK